MKQRTVLLLVGLLLIFGGAALVWAGDKRVGSGNSEERGQAGKNSMQKNVESIVLGGGCFWCIEAVFQSFRGVQHVESGYAGGTMPKPDYHSVSAGTTGHAEVVRVDFDPAQISLRQIVTIFFHAHDPTTKDRQGADVGSQYRSVILYQSDAQRQTAESVKAEIEEARLWGEKSIVTEIDSLSEFYRAEDYHQDYYRNNPQQGYCAMVIAPKLRKIRKEFADLLEPSAS
jgi:peptide-methionine (S)-S-oxide reductase